MTLPSRAKFVRELKRHLGRPVVWAHKGPEVFDCSGLVTYSLWRCGAKDMRMFWNANRIMEECDEIPEEDALPGDFVFYGGKTAVHVAVIFDSVGRVISASGARPDVNTVDAAKKLGAAVKLHSQPKYRNDFICICRNKWVSDDAETKA